MSKEHNPCRASDSKAGDRASRQTFTLPRQLVVNYTRSMGPGSSSRVQRTIPNDPVPISTTVTSHEGEDLMSEEILEMMAKGAIQEASHRG